jgi:hypothetical protein
LGGEDFLLPFALHCLHGLRCNAASPVWLRSKDTGRCATSLRCSRLTGDAPTRCAQTRRVPFSANRCAARPRPFAAPHRPCRVAVRSVACAEELRTKGFFDFYFYSGAGLQAPQNTALNFSTPRSLPNGAPGPARLRRREAQGGRSARAQSRVLRGLTHRVCLSGESAANAASYAMDRLSEHRRAAAQRPAQSGRAGGAVRQALFAEVTAKAGEPRTC